jgi:GGDEF domain-containing protein
VDYSTPVSYVSNLAVKRKSENIYDCIIISEGNNYRGLITIKEILEYITEKNVEMAKNSNPLTGLPGNMLIDDKLDKVIKVPGKKHVLYFDLDNFKAYNDIYGFENGDKVLKMTGELLEQIIGKLGIEKSFLGHIGGDDFIAIIEIEDPVPLLENIIKIFDARVKGFYSEKDANRGYFISYDRKGEIDMFPLTTMSISVVPMAKKNFSDSEDLARHISYLKRKCKQNIGSCYYIDDDDEDEDE